jgi:hypothetical protein
MLFNVLNFLTGIGFAPEYVVGVVMYCVSVVPVVALCPTDVVALPMPILLFDV